MPAIDLVSENPLDKKRILMIGGGLVVLVLIVLGLVYFFTDYLKKTETFQNAAVDGEEYDEGEYGEYNETSGIETFSNEATVDNLGLSESQVGLVKVSATWCGHCKSMQSDWDKVHAEFNGKKVNGKPMSVLTFDENHPLQEEIMTKHSIDGYPTIFKCEMQNGQLSKPEIYNGTRSYSGLVEFLNA